jgi:U4/U6.U5 tri-snRNP-associated protein 1
MADAISIEETNKIRAAIGLKPLPVPGAGPSFKLSHDESDGSSSEEEDVGSTLESREAQGYGNWKKVQDEAEAKAKREAKTAAVKRARDAALRFSKLEGKGLGEVDEASELDTRSWLMQQKKRQKKIDKERARKMEEELREREKLAEYTAKDLAGVKVGHEMGDFEAGEQVLVLKDATIEENEEEGDELENLELKEKEKLGEKLELKKRKPAYNPNDMDDDEEKVLLKQYDETIDGKKRKRFTLDAQGSTVESREAMKQTVGARLKAQTISLDFLNEVPTSDYVDAPEVKIRKPKKKKLKSTRQKTPDEDDIFPITDSNPAEVTGDTMDIDSGNGNISKPSRQDVSFIDDDDLQASLAKSRRAALKKRQKVKPEDIARQLREEASATPDPERDLSIEEGGLVLDETSEFVANLQRHTAPEKPRNASSAVNGAPKRRSLSPSAADVEEDIRMGGIEETDDTRNTTPAPADLTVTGLDEESTLSNGVGATLSLLRQRDLVKKVDSGDLNKLHRERQKFLAGKHAHETAAEQKARIQRERDRASGKLDRMSAREREEYARWENKQRDQADSRQMAEIFNREYKPNVQLKYVDEHGRAMGPKEAFKDLSHQFHGKGSGKQKTEKHLKKIADEKRKEAQSSLDSSQATGMNNALGATTKKNKQVGVRLA